MLILTYTVILLYLVYMGLLGMLIYAHMQEVDQYQKDYNKLLQQYERVEQTLAYMTRVRVEKEKVFGKNGNTISQHYLDLPDLGVSPVVVPYNPVKVVNGVPYTVHFNQIWTWENWQNFQKEKYWVKYTDKQGKRNKVYKAWVDEPLKDDVRLDYIEVYYDDDQDCFKVNSGLPCKWEYEGYAELA